jgi:replicative DNA helicase
MPSGWESQVHDIEAERYTLAACLIAPGTLEEVADVIMPDDFYRPAHQDIFDALLVMYLAGEAVSPVTLAVWMEREGQKPNREYLAELYAIPASAPMAVSHARIVWECAVRRRVQDTGVRLGQLAGQPDMDPAEILGRAQAYLEGAAAVREGNMALRLPEHMRLKDEASTPVIENLVNHQDRVVVVAFEGAGKTQLAFQVAFGVAAGVHPLTFDAMPAGRALIADFENPQSNLQRRCRSLAEVAAQSPRWDQDNVMVYSRPGGIDLSLPDHAFRFAEVIRRARPDIIVAGPIYKMMTETGDGDVGRHAAIARFCDRMRELHGCAWWLETHAPIQVAQGKRTMRPIGSGIWSRWPEFGISLLPGKQPGSLELDRFRGDRDQDRLWPERLDRNRGTTGPAWPWVATFPTGSLL